ncbi:MAG TPA: sigma 54-interacting transcriptional regulator [Pyrinomonadaceae bacterium]|nr:sigma 54-interacting transcriptional regulator [Pyrinomonadaceae bacterium]
MTKLAEHLNPRLVAINGSKKGTTFPLAADQITIGRESASAVSLKHASVSRRHCVIEREGDTFKIRDLGSSNGTFVNGQPVNDKILNHADQVRIGSIALLFLIEETEDTTSGHLVRFDDSQPINESAKQLRPESLLHQTEVVVDLSEHERLTRDLGVLVKIGTRISRLRHTQELVREILDSIFDVVPVDRGAILLSQAEKEFSLIHGKHRREQATEVRVSRTVVEHVLREGIAILTNDIATSESLSAADSLMAAQISSLICVPLIVFDKTLGVIYLDTSDPIIRFDEAHLQLVAAIAGMAAVSIENARQLEWLESENSRLRSTLAIEHNMIGESAAMREVYSTIQRVAPARSAVLICGESGTGKELAANAIHNNSPRAAQPFVAINCAALTETLLESELFGHEKGAFTGAITRKEGKLEVANRGTVFLDEIGEMPLPMQSRLLRFLQDHKIEHVGGTRSIDLDVRVIAATNRDLEAAIKSGTFRQDLYHRLNVVKITMPSLHERREDIPLLASYFAEKYANECKRPVNGITPEARAVLQNYDWPGNVRELENAIERAIVLGSSDRIGVDDLPRRVVDSAENASATEATYYEAIKDAKRLIVLNALEQSKGNYTEAAKALGIHANNLHRIIRTLDLKAALAKWM